MLAKRHLALLIAASLSAGCAVGPDYVRPGMVMPERYNNADALGRGETSTRADSTEWWAHFGDPLLTRYVLRALDQNLDLAQASARVVQAQAGLGAANAALLPSGNVSGQAARAYQSVETSLGQVLNSTPGFDRYGNAYQVDIGASWELDLFGGLQRSREAALAEYQASEAGVAATRLVVAAHTADAYIRIRGLQTRLDLVRRKVQTQQELVETIQLLYSKGLAAERQLHQAEGGLAQMQSVVPGLEAELDAVMNALDVMLGSSPGTHRAELVKVSAIPVAPRIDMAGSPADLLRRRPDLIVAERRLAASNARIGAAMADYYPKFSLGGLVGSATTVSAGNLFSSGANQAAGMLGLRWRLFDFGRINAQISQAKGQEAELLAAYRLAVLRATEDVENALTAFSKHDEQRVVIARGVDSLRRARSASWQAYQKGIVNRIELLQADLDLLGISDTSVQFQVESARAAIAVFKSLGGGFQANVTQN